MFFVTKAHHEREIAGLDATIDEIEEEKDHYRELWISENNKVKELERKLVNETHMHSTTKTQYLEAMNLYHRMTAEVLTVKPENIILRQILEDLTGRSADDLIEAHKRAVRMLEYGIEVPKLPENKVEL